MYVEYNLINNVPILYPDNRDCFKYAPRYTISTPETLLHCFDAEKKEILIKNVKFRYMRVPLHNRVFKTLHNNVKALYYYVIVDNSIDWDGYDYHNPGKIFRWFKTMSNHYVIVTTPILQYKNVWYSVANDHQISIIQHSANELMDDNSLILKLIDANCFTICDNYNIAISLYRECHVDKSTFMKIIQMLNQMKNFYYTSGIWMYLMNHHRLLSACDFPVLYLGDVDDDIMGLFDMFMYENKQIYLQTYYQEYILFTSFVGACYPVYNLKYIKKLLGENVNNQSLMFNYMDDYAQDQFVHDYYGLFATIVSKQDVWNYWNKTRMILTEKMISNIFDVLCSLFKLYNVGFEGVRIRKARVREVWKYILSNSGENHFIKEMIITKDLNVPYIFWMDVYERLNIDFGMKQLIYDNNHLLRYTNLYSLLHYRTVKDSLYYFHRNVLYYRSIYILMCIYKKFEMFTANNTNKYLQGVLIIHYLQKNMYYLT